MSPRDKRPASEASATRQQQFLDVVELEAARAAWTDALPDVRARVEQISLEEALGRVLATDVRAPGDVPAFDRSNVDGFAVRAEDTFGASESRPARLRIVGPPIDAGHAPEGELGAGEARPLATGGALPRGADAVSMIEETHAAGEHVLVERPVAPAGRVSAAGSDITQGETILRTGTMLSARETAIAAACGLAVLPCLRRPRVAILSTGDEIVACGTELALGQVHDANSRALADTVRELGAEARTFGIAGDDPQALEARICEALEASDVLLLSGGTSKGRGDVTYRVVEALGTVVVHGVALKPGKPLCLAVVDEKPVVVLPGFPTSALFTFHAAVAPMLRRMLGRPERAPERIAARMAARVVSERGRTEFDLVQLLRGRQGWLAYPLGKGSGSVTTFARADGFVTIGTQVERVDQDDPVEVTLLGRGLKPADLVVAGSHCTGLDVLVQQLRERHPCQVQVLSLGSREGIAAARAGACHVAPLHLRDAETGAWNGPFAPEGTQVVPGYARQQGIAVRLGDAACLQSAEPEEVLATLLRDLTKRIANRNPASGTRALLDAFVARAELPEARPPGWGIVYRSHSAVASAIRQGRADWGICLPQAARAAGLSWLAWQTEHYDFLMADEHAEHPPLRAFLETLRDPATRAALTSAGFTMPALAEDAS